MQAQELLETYDKAAVVIKQFYLQHMLESLNDENLPENFKDFVKEQGIDNDTVAVMLTASPRTFFDVFDNHKIYIEIHINSKNAIIFRNVSISYARLVSDLSLWFVLYDKSKLFILSILLSHCICNVSFFFVNIFNYWHHFIVINFFLISKASQPVFFNFLVVCDHVCFFAS
jgi:hypothetical protein